MTKGEFKKLVKLLPNGCWEWLGSYADKYPQCSDKAVPSRKATHLSLLLFKKVIVPRGRGNAVRHTCDYKPCVNPEHLISGTQAENLEDMRAKGRAYYPGPSEEGRKVLSALGKARPFEYYRERLLAAREKTIGRKQSPEQVRKRCAASAAVRIGKPLSSAHKQAMKDAWERRRVAGLPVGAQCWNPCTKKLNGKLLRSANARN